MPISTCKQQRQAQSDVLCSFCTICALDISPVISVWQLGCMSLCLHKLDMVTGYMLCLNTEDICMHNNRNRRLRQYQEQVLQICWHLAPNHSQVQITSGNSLAAAPGVLHHKVDVHFCMLLLELLCTARNQLTMIASQTNCVRIDIDAMYSHLLLSE